MNFKERIDEKYNEMIDIVGAEILSSESAKIKDLVKKIQNFIKDSKFHSDTWLNCVAEQFVCEYVDFTSKTGVESFENSTLRLLNAYFDDIQGDFTQYTFEISDSKNKDKNKRTISVPGFFWLEDMVLVFAAAFGIEMSLPYYLTISGENVDPYVCITRTVHNIFSKVAKGKVIFKDPYTNKSFKVNINLVSKENNQKFQKLEDVKLISGAGKWVLVDKTSKEMSSFNEKQLEEYSERLLEKFFLYKIAFYSLTAVNQVVDGKLDLYTALNFVEDMRKRILNGTINHEECEAGPLEACDMITDYKTSNYLN